jgi:hypothetical protein
MATVYMHGIPYDLWIALFVKYNQEEINKEVEKIKKRNQEEQ